MMKNADAFFQKLKNDLVGGLNTIAIGKIESFDATKTKADIKLIPDGDLVVAVPVAMPQTSEFIIRLPYKKGDLVVVAFGQREIDDLMLGGDKVEGERMLSVDDAIVIGGLNLFTNKLPSANSDDLVIAKKDLTSKIVLKSNGDIVVENTGNVFVGGADATEGIPLGDQLKTWLDGHTHTDSAGGTTTAPNSNSPSPSMKVKVK